jgi:sec-independent protein translocase protein TatB
MFANFGFGEIAVLALVAILIFGPEKLPKAAMDAARIIKKLRSMADLAVNDFKAELPPDLADLNLRSLHPRHIVQSALLDPHTPHHGSANSAATPDLPDGLTAWTAVRARGAGTRDAHGREQ